MTYSDVTWNSTTADDVTISNGTVTSTNTTNNFDSKAQSSTTFPSGDILKISGWTAGKQLVGLGKDPYDATGETSEYLEVDYGVYFNSNTFTVYELGNNYTTQAGSATDTIYIKNTSGTITYHLNDPTATPWYTSLTTASSTLYAHATLQNQGSITCQTSATSSGGGGGGSSGSTPDNTDGSTPLEHILYLNTRVPR